MASVTIRHVFLVLGVLLLGYLFAQLGLRTIAMMVLSLRWAFAPVLLLYGGHQLARACALRMCVPPNRSLTLRDALAIRLSGEAVQFLTFSGPILSEPTKAMLLQRRGLTVWEGLGTTLAEYLASSVSAAVMAVIGLTYVLAVLRPTGPTRVAALIILVSMAIFVLAFTVGLVFRLHLIGGIVRGVARLPLVRGKLGHRIAGLPASEELLLDTLAGSPTRLAGILAIEAVGQVLLGIEMFVLVSALQPSFSLGSAMLVEGATKFITAGYFFVPGQVGVAEGSYMVIFTVFGLSAQAGVTVSFVRRLRSMVTAGIGLAALSRADARRQLEQPGVGKEG